MCLHGGHSHENPEKKQGKNLFPWKVIGGYIGKCLEK